MLALTVLLLTRPGALCASPFEPAAIPSNAWTDIDVAVRRAWHTRDLAALDVLLSQGTAEKTGDGYSRHWLAWRVVERVISYGPREHPAKAAETAAFVERWQAAYPDSGAACFARALQHAHHARWTADPVKAPSLPPSGWQPTIATLEEGAATLQGCRSRNAAEPHWFAAAMQLAILRNTDDAELVALSQDASAAHADYLAPQFHLLTHLIEDRGWTGQEIEPLLRSVARPTSRVRMAPTVYARLYLYLFEAHHHDQLLQKTAPDWPTLREGLRDLTRVPDNQRAQNQRAALACLAGDRRETAEALRAAAAVEREVWRMPRFHQDCSDWSTPQQGSR